MTTTRRKFLSGSARAALGVVATDLAGKQASAADDRQPLPGPSVTLSRQVPLRYEADVVVIGGGIAGVATACAAARSGVRVLLVERFAVTGGMLTTGGVANFCGQLTGQGEVFDQILADLRAFGAIEPNKPVFHYEILALILQEMLLARKVKLLLHTRFVDAIERDGRITEAIVCGKSGLEAIRGKIFIDASGEADLARACGFSVMKGRPEDGLQLPMSVMFFVRHLQAGDKRPLLPKGWLHPVRTKKELPMTSVWPDGARSNALKVKIPMFDSTSTESLTAAEIQARRRMMEVLDYYQRVEKKEWMLDHCSPVIGIREGCRVTGDYVLSLADLRTGRSFEDAVARGTYQLDGHKPDDDKRTYILPENQLQVPPYQIPLRSLIAKDGKNLIMAGRCFSADQLALSSARVSTSAAMMGQAAGVAAALCVAKACDPRQLDPAQVRKILEERGAQLAV